ncbi:hypothetical protein B0T21DRAFT_369323 [Apiosordaria backusii]|uniref:Uncharacterized protein n=1 Tax=Apiosordaria backusii TaxID=314023 RepID=A0AA40EBX4_9PEZI|nr:hypothetical protein B0T21DRAFT_369323 [Apiosordaria backusii]
MGSTNCSEHVNCMICYGGVNTLPMLSNHRVFGVMNSSRDRPTASSSLLLSRLKVGALSVWTITSYRCGIS